MHVRATHLFHVRYIFHQSSANNVGRSLHHHPRLQPHRAVRAHPALVTHTHVLPRDWLQRQRRRGLLHFDQQLENLVVLCVNQDFVVIFSVLLCCGTNSNQRMRGRVGVLYYWVEYVRVGVCACVNLLQCFLGTL